jgi:hypothetical protein
MRFAQFVSHPLRLERGEGRGEVSNLTTDLPRRARARRVNIDEHGCIQTKIYEQNFDANFANLLGYSFDENLFGREAALRRPLRRAPASGGANERGCVCHKIPVPSSLR